MILLNISEDPIVQGIIGSLIAGFLTIGIVEYYKYWRLYLFNLKFKKLFGTYDEEKINLVLPALSVRQDVLNLLQTSNLQDNQFPLLKYGGSFIKSSKLLSYADTIALKYILEIVSKVFGTKSKIVTDEDLQNKLDISFVAFGGSNFYCSYILAQTNNRFYNFNGNSIISKTNLNSSFQINQTYDYGLILKYRHINFPEKTWIIVAGLGESGTRGASWFLSKNWKEISDRFNEKEFGLVVRVDHGIDNSAIEVHSTT
jgi:hypothetical protein